MKKETIQDVTAEMRQSAETMRCAQKPYTEHLLRTFADRLDLAARPLRNCDRFADGKTAFDAWNEYAHGGGETLFADWLFAPYETEAETTKETTKKEKTDADK